VITPFRVDRLHEQTRDHHHPHYTHATKDDVNRVTYHFQPFTGDEPEPTHPKRVPSHPDFAPAREFLATMYRQARDLWQAARYLRALTATTNGASELWDTYAQNRTAMEEAFAGLRDTTDLQWHAAVSALVSAHELALAAAEVWDAKAADIARVHHDHRHAALGEQQAYLRAGINAAGWRISSASAYHPWRAGRTPLVAEVRKAIERQREHIRAVADLTGDRTAL
jgi:hypothetical protein